MIWLFTTTLAIVTCYLRSKITEEIESLSAAIICCLSLLISLIFAPLLVKFIFLLVLLLFNQKSLTAVFLCLDL
jgi:hypothetical protein